MRTLVANIPLPANRVLRDLNHSLERYMELRQDHDAFWEMRGNFDIVHLHFPEYLTYEIQDAYCDSLSDTLISEIEKRLKYWSDHSTLVITRHNVLPHNASADSRWERLIETTYRYMDGVVHFAEPSIEEFKVRYANTSFIHGQPQHCVIPHHNYVSLPNQVSRQAAREALGVPANANVVLVFGSIRNDEERELILHSFKGLDVPNKVLLVSRWPEKLANVSWIRLKYWLRDLTRLYYKLHPQYHFNYGFVEEEDAQIHLNAADVLFIPRLHVLNSGNITLGMTFGKVVVGPDSLDVGHLLKTTGNVVFDPDKPETASAAIEHAMDLAKLNQIGSANQHRALAEWSADQCADQYFTFFSQLTSERTQS